MCIGYKMAETLIEKYDLEKYIDDRAEKGLAEELSSLPMQVSFIESEGPSLEARIACRILLSLREIEPPLVFIGKLDGILEIDLDMYQEIKKTMRHRTLKGAVCDRRSFFGCSRSHHTLKCVVF